MNETSENLIRHEKTTSDLIGGGQSGDLLAGLGHESEDTSVVEAAELWGWYSLSVAMEPYALVGTAVLGPLVMQQLAASVGWEHDNHSIPCNTTGSFHCDVNLAGAYIDTSSLVLYATSLSVIIQMLLFIPIGSMADYGNLRRFFVFLFGFLNAAAGILILLVVNNNMWWLSFLSVNVAGIFLGAANVFGLAYIPILTRYSPEVLQARNSLSPKESEEKAFERVGNTISSNGIAYASLGAVAMFIICAGFVLLTLNVQWTGLPSTWSMQLAMAACSIFQFVILAFYSFPRVKNRPGKPLPTGETYMSQSFKSLKTVLKNASSLKQLFRMLVAWFCYSDAFNTVASAAILFGQSQLGAGITILLASAAMVPIFSAIGAWAFTYVQRRNKLTTRQILMIQAFMYTLLPLYGCIGFFTPAGSFGLQNKYELIITGAYHGFLFGSTQSSCRVLFSEMIPAGHESQFFSLYEITDKGSSWVGPLVVAAITSATGNIRYAFIFLSLFFCIPIYLFYIIDDAQGRQDAKTFALEIHELPNNS